MPPRSTTRCGGTQSAIERLLFAGPRPLARAIEAILVHPDRTLRPEPRLVPVEELQDPDPDRLFELMGDPTTTCPAGPASPHFSSPAGGFCFSQAWDSRVSICHDTPANAALLRLLELLRRDLAACGGGRRGAGGAPVTDGAGAAYRKLERWRQIVAGLGARTSREQALGGVVLERDPRFQEVRRALHEYRRWRREAVDEVGDGAGQDDRGKE